MSVTSRRLFNKIAIGGFYTTLTSSALSIASAQEVKANAAVEQMHQELWKRFIDKHGIMLDFTDLDGTVTLPTPEECRLGKPNALGWFQPIENGAMFNGMYLDGIITRWERSGDVMDAEKARRLMNGLLFLNTISDVKGFVGRGVSTDGRSHFPMGSNDQTSPWFFGLYRYWQSKLASPEEKSKIENQVIETAEVIIRAGWRMPAEEPFRYRGSFSGHTFNGLSRRLFVLKWLHRMTGDAKWNTQYQQELAIAKPAYQDPTPVTPVKILQKGMVYEYAKTHNWTSACEVACLRGLWELETDPVLKQAFGAGLNASARLAAESFALADQYDPNHPSTFNPDWRAAMMPIWRPQVTEQEAETLAKEQLKTFLKISPRRQQETAFVREPTSAAWIVTLAADTNLIAKYRPQIETLVQRFDYRRLYYSTFFWIESAWWRIA